MGVESMVLWSCERRPTMDCPPTPQFCLNFLLRSKTYLKECPPRASIVNREFPLSVKPEGVVRLVYTHYKVQITCTMVYTSTRCLAHHVMHLISCQTLLPKEGEREPGAQD